MRLRSLDLPVFLYPYFYAGSFNYCHDDWCYDNNSPDGECLASWTSINSLAVLHNLKGVASFYSGHWNTGTNPYVALSSVDPYHCLPDRHVFEKFPRDSRNVFEKFSR